MDQAYTLALVATGMVAALTAGWQAGRVMSPRPRVLRDAAWEQRRLRESAPRHRPRAF